MPCPTLSVPSQAWPAPTSVTSWLNGGTSGPNLLPVPRAGSRGDRFCRATASSRPARSLVRSRGDRRSSRLLTTVTSWLNGGTSGPNLLPVPRPGSGRDRVCRATASSRPLDRWFDHVLIAGRVVAKLPRAHSGDDRSRTTRRSGGSARANRPTTPRLGDPDGTPGPRPVPGGHEPGGRHVTVDRWADRVGRTDRCADGTHRPPRRHRRPRRAPPRLSRPGPSAGRRPAQAARAAPRPPPSAGHPTNRGAATGRG